MFRTTPIAAIRGMLRFAKDSERLASLPIVRELCSLTGTSDPRAMLDGVIASAFNDTPQEQRLREILMEDDDCTTAARRFNLSLRHFHRMRSHAVSLVSLRVEDILDSARLEDRDGAVSNFELASLEFEVAQRESNLSAMSAALRAMRAHSRLRRDFEFRRHMALAAFFLRSGQPA